MIKKNMIKKIDKNSPKKIRTILYKYHEIITDVT
jgi:hypothetical protein